MIDTKAIEARIQWLSKAVDETFAWALADETDPALIKHTNAMTDAMILEHALLMDVLREATA
jgi:hypothetical protein